MAAQHTEDDKALLDLWVRRVEHFEQTLGSFYRDGLWADMDKLYHGWTRLREALRGTRGRSRTDTYRDAQEEFGHELSIPHAFAIVETVLPALLSNRPHILVLPNGEGSTRNVRNMKSMLDKQQSQISIELRLQSVAKESLQKGLGVGKSYWLRREGHRTKLVPLVSWHPARAIGKEATVEVCSEPLFDDPTFEHVPVTRFGWDPFAANIETARYAWDINFRDTGYVKARLEDGTWSNIALDPEDYETAHGSADRYRKSVQGSFDAQGIPIPNPQDVRDSDIHEVIELHDRGSIVTILDRTWIVLKQPNETNYGRLPYACYRPTEVPGQMVGKGEIEPVRDLAREMDMIRTDRRWNSLMAQGPVLFAQEGVVEPDKIKVGPGEINLVNGDPHDLIWQMEIKDVPNSSWRETAEIAADIVRASGISDTFAGGESGSSETATGVQLQLARASARIQNKTRRAEIELIKPVGEHWVRLNQRHITTQREVRVPAPPVPGQPERVWAQYMLGPNELAGNFDIEIDGGSTTPENVPQKRQDAQIKATLMSGPLGALFDPRQMAISILEDLGEKNPESKLNAGAVVPPEALDMIIQNLVAMGVQPEVAQQIVEESLHQALDMKDRAAMAADHGQGSGHGEQESQAPPEQDDQQQAA